MSLTTDLNKLMPALSAKERAMLVLRSMVTMTPENPRWRDGMTQDQTDAFNHYVSLMNATNMYLPLYITVVEQFVERCFAKLHRLWTLTELGTCVWKIAELVPASKRKEAEQLAAGGLLGIELPWRGEKLENSWFDLADSMEAHLREDVVGLWQEIRAIEILLDEVSAEFNGEDVLRPFMRGQLQKARRRLTALHDYLNNREPLELLEPTDETRELVQVYFNKGYDLYKKM